MLLIIPSGSRDTKADSALLLNAACLRDLCVSWRLMEALRDVLRLLSPSAAICLCHPLALIQPAALAFVPRLYEAPAHTSGSWREALRSALLPALPPPLSFHATPPSFPSRSSELPLCNLSHSVFSHKEMPNKQGLFILCPCGKHYPGRTKPKNRK